MHEEIRDDVLVFEPATRPTEHMINDTLNNVTFMCDVHVFCDTVDDDDDKPHALNSVINNISVTEPSIVCLLCIFLCALSPTTRLTKSTRNTNVF